MRYSDFRRCGIRAFNFAHRLKHWGCDPILRYGIFRPQKPKALWDERWQLSRCNEFSHAWIDIEDVYVDISATQFGEKGLFITQKRDQRYQIIGTVDLFSGLRIPLKFDEIEWKSLYQDSLGIPRMRVLED